MEVWVERVKSGCAAATAHRPPQVLAQCNLREKAFEAGRADGALAAARKGLHSRLREIEAFIGAALAAIPTTRSLQRPFRVSFPLLLTATCS